MNDASQWRSEIAQEIASVYAQIPTVKAVLLGGSVAHGWADQYSDTELGIFWSELPTIDQQHMILTELGARPRFGKIFPFRHTEPYEPGCGYSPFLVGEAPRSFDTRADYPPSESGYPMEADFESVVGTEKCLIDVVDELDTSTNKQQLLSVIQTGIPFYGEALIQKWRKKIEVYPSQLAFKIIQSKLKSLRWGLWEQEIRVHRNEGIILVQGMCGIVHDLLMVLLALNRMYCPSETLKWMDHIIQGMQIKPENLSVRLRQGFHLESREGVRHLRNIVEETLELIEEHFPELDFFTHESVLTSCWRTWPNPPVGWKPVR